MVNFNVKKIFPRKLSFLDFCKKIKFRIHIFRKGRYCLKQKNELNFSTSSLWKSNKNYGQKNLFKENGKKIATRRIFGGFLKTFRRTCVLSLVADIRSAEKIQSSIFAKTREIIEKSDFQIFFFRFRTKNLYFSAILVSFESTSNWLSINTKITTVGPLT